MVLLRPVINEDHINGRTAKKETKEALMRYTTVKRVSL